MASRVLLSPSLLQTIQRGDAILFLGAGAVFGCEGDERRRGSVRRALEGIFSLR